ncbi:MAG TPA: (2Fe-2S)-binding protein [Acidimicrobiales bacterium]|jgi:bacterioferritin-associated ferredoxin
MLICHCEAVNDRKIREVVARGACDEFEVGLECGAGTRCGGCLDEVRRLCATSDVLVQVA